MTSILSPDQRTALQQQLQSEYEQLSRVAEGLDRTFDDLVEDADLEPPDDEHDPDGTTAYERAQVTSTAASTRARLTELRTALEALERDDFGACARCADAIGMARLEALPGTTLCVDCATNGPDLPGPPLATLGGDADG